MSEENKKNTENEISKLQIKASIIPIKINMTTNILNHFKQEFTSSLLYHPELKNISGLNKYPYFTNLFRYKEEYIFNLPYEKIVRFFFDETTFLEKINKYGTLNKNGNQNNLHNIMVMLKALFHINKKIIDETIGNSFENKYGKMTEIVTELGEKASSLMNEVFNKNKLKNLMNMNVKDYYTYIKIGGDTYTFQRVIWLNDLKSHPFYKELMKEYNMFNRWLNTKKGLKYKDILNKNSFEMIEKIYNEEKKYSKFYGYYKKESEKNLNTEKELIISLYSQPEFKKLYDTLKKYQYIESKNEILQNTIETTLSGNSTNFAEKENILKILHSLTINGEEIDKTKDKNIYYTDILHDIKNDNYEITILADFIKGEMNDEKYKNMKCNYQSNKLGEFLEENILMEKKSLENKNKNTIYSIDENKIIEVNNNENNEAIEDKVNIKDFKEDLNKEKDINKDINKYINIKKNVGGKKYTIKRKYRGKRKYSIRNKKI